MTTRNKMIVVLDLDDTLYNEIDYLKSAYSEISYFISDKSGLSAQFVFAEMVSFYREGKNSFLEILKSTKVENISVVDLLNIYRNHTPKIQLSSQNKKTLLFLKDYAFKLGLITDGRSIQQRNKIKSLGLEFFLDDIIISEEFGSEKPAIKNFNYFNDKYGDAIYIYIGDNLKKDFIGPNALGWTSVCLLDQGKNIHSQNISLTAQQTPTFQINSLDEIGKVLERLN